LPIYRDRKSDPETAKKLGPAGPRWSWAALRLSTGWKPALRATKSGKRHKCRMPKQQVRCALQPARLVSPASTARGSHNVSPLPPQPCRLPASASCARSLYQHTRDQLPAHPQLVGKHTRARLARSKVEQDWGGLGPGAGLLALFSGRLHTHYGYKQHVLNPEHSRRGRRRGISRGQTRLLNTTLTNNKTNNDNSNYDDSSY
jgi:hypothetical protein